MTSLIPFDQVPGKYDPLVVSEVGQVNWKVSQHHSRGRIGVVKGKISTVKNDWSIYKDGTNLLRILRGEKEKDKIKIREMTGIIVTLGIHLQLWCLVHSEELDNK